MYVCVCRVMKSCCLDQLYIGNGNNHVHAEREGYLFV